VGLSMELNGVGFGVEGEGRGWQRVGPEMERRVGQAGQGRYMAQLEHGVFWRLGEGVGREDESLLVEERRIRFMIEARRREVVMEWVSEFRVGGLESEVALGMGEGEGFRVQLVPGFSGVELKESGGRVWERGDGGGRSSGEGEWLVVKGEMEGRTLSLCFFGGVGKAGRLVWDAEGDRGLRLCLRPGEGGMPGRLVLGDRLTLKYWVVLRLGELTADEVQLIRAKAGD
jgi:hypothetical protein